MGKQVAIVQSNYVPWKGYFDLINLVDEFILYDDVQYTRRDWRNRNLIKSPQGLRWLTIPVEVKGKYEQRICDTKIADPGWTKSHWSSIAQNYSNASFLADCRGWLEPLYSQCNEQFLSRVNLRFISAICEYLGIGTRVSWSLDYDVKGDRNERLMELCKRVGGTTYISGPAAKGYLDEEMFRAAGISVAWMDYSGYPEYHQLHGAFDHGVSILDLLLNEGPGAVKFMKSFQPS